MTCDCVTASPPPVPYWLVGARAAHLGATLLLFGLLAFDRLVAAPVARRHAARSGTAPSPGGRAPETSLLALLALAVALASGAAWFVLVAADMNDCTPREALRPDVLRVVWGGTHFGRLWQLRSLLWLAATLLAPPALFLPPATARRAALTWAALAAAGALLASLAWAGHGLAGIGPVAPAHLPADVLHLLFSGLWPVGLLPFALLLRRLRRRARAGDVHAQPAVSDLTRRFSAASLTSVALLTATGCVNSWMLVGSFAALRGTPYGKILLVKLALFCLMLLPGAVNLLYLKPRLAAEAIANQRADAARLQFNVTVELVLGTLIVVAVALLGVLPPAME